MKHVTYNMKHEIQKSKNIIKKYFKVLHASCFMLHGPSASRQKGVTLLELLVSISLFTATVTIVVAVFIAMSSAQKRSAKSVDIDNSSYFALEAMAKEIRTGSNFTFPEAVTTGFSDLDVGVVCSWANINSSCQILRFINYRGQIVIYKLDNAIGTIERACIDDAVVSGGDGDGVIDPTEKDCFSNLTTHLFSQVTPINTMRVTDLRFNLDGHNQNGNPDRKQARVIIVLKAETPAGTPLTSKRDIILQTVISGRGPDS